MTDSTDGLMTDPVGLSREARAAMTVAVVDDDPVIRRIVRARVEREGVMVEEFERGTDIVKKGVESFDAVCLDLGLGKGDMGGLEVLPHLRSSSPDVPVIVVTAQNDLESIVEAMRRGAYDFVPKPIEGDRLKISLNRALERRALSKRVAQLLRELDTAREKPLIVGASSAIRQMLETVRRVVDSDVAVCILGESGTGKELVARTVHEGGRRKKGPFVAINCASIPEHLQESELFGHEKGAFTGALTTHRGRFEQAEGGTLFLDELGDMSLATQVKLLRAIQEKSIRRVGGTSDVPTNVRLIAATHRDLEVLVRRGGFREDLYFRLMVYPIEVPPLRDRLDDLPLLVAHFLRAFKDDVGRDISRVSKEALDGLSAHRWSGNVRELQNVVHRAMLTCSGDEITFKDLPPSLQRPMLPPIPEGAAGYTSGPSSGPSSEPPVSLRARGLPTLQLKELEAMAIQAALAQTNGHMASAAKLLGLGRATLYRRVVEAGLKVDLGEPPASDKE